MGTVTGGSPYLKSNLKTSLTPPPEKLRRASSYPPQGHYYYNYFVCMSVCMIIFYKIDLHTYVTVVMA